MNTQPKEKPTVNELNGRQSEIIRGLVGDSEFCFGLADAFSSPIHAIIPHEIATNLRDLYRATEVLETRPAIYLAHKPTKSPALIRMARRLGVGLDVASRTELCSGLAAGFTGSSIECTGSKSRDFLELALIHQCLISIDSVAELQAILEVRKSLKLKTPTRILLRVTDLTIPGRIIRGRVSRFGIPAAEIGQAFTVLRSTPDFCFEGFHLHNDRRDSNDRAAQIQALLQLTVDAFKLGFEPTKLNIGGGFRRPVFSDTSAWPNFVGSLEEQLVQGEHLPTVGAYSYGLQLNTNGKIVGRGRALALGAMPDFTSVLPEILTAPAPEGGSIASFLDEASLQLLIEPGAALLDQCGVSFFEVNAVKRGGGGKHYVAVQGNMYNLATQYKEYLPDPILLTRSPQKKASTPFFLIGNLCREEDYLMKRAVAFPSVPAVGDLICFPNTAAYRMDFEDAAPHQHSRGTQVVVAQDGARHRLLHENNLHMLTLGS